MRVLLVSGGAPSGMCGVEDYTVQLVERLRSESIDAVRFEWSQWSWRHREATARAILATNADIVHVQYPARGYGSSRTPAWLFLRLRHVPKIVTLHEYSAQVGPPLLGIVPRGLPFYWPFSTASRIVFSNPHESERFLRIAPWAARRIRIIPIASNIPEAAPRPRSARVVYFGQICPGKGIEDFLWVAGELRPRQPDLAFELIGNVPEVARPYADALLRSASRAGVTHVAGASATEVADRLASSLAAFLPFPDGASEKRGSLLAALSNGLAVVTYHSRSTPEWIRECTVGVASRREAIEALERCSTCPALRAQLEARIRVHLPRFAWQAVAREHVSLYEQVVRAG